MPKPPKKGKKLDPQRTDQLIESYSESAVSVLLDDAFNKWDEQYDKSITLPYLDRADHIIINGRVATDLLVEKFSEEFPNMNRRDGTKFPDDERNQAYGQFYRDNGKKLVNQMVFNALASGGKVEVYVPDKATGQIKDLPVKLTATGYNAESALKKPAQLTGWQRFWGKFGFYRRERAAIANYEKEVEAREKVKFCNKAGRAANATVSSISETILNELIKHHPGTVEDMRANFPESEGFPEKLDPTNNTNGYKVMRSSFYSTAMAVLATKKDENGKLLYTNEQLFDMNDKNMQKARAEALKEVYDHYKPGAMLRKEMEKKQEAEDRGEKYDIDDNLVKEAAQAKDWLVDLQYDSADVIRNRISDQASKLDFSKPDLTEQKGYREFGLLSDVAFDISQDASINSNRMNEKYGPDACSKATAKVGDCSQLSRYMGKSLFSQKLLFNGIPGAVQPRKGQIPTADGKVCNLFGAVFKGQAYQQHVANTLKANPDMKYADAVNEELLFKAASIEMNSMYDGIAIRRQEEEGEELPHLMQKSIQLGQDYVRNPEQFKKQIQNGVLESRIKMTNEVGEFEILDANMVEREMKQQQKEAGGTELGA